MESLDILLLQETKIDEYSLLLLSNSKWKLNYGKSVSDRGTCGGLATLWSEKIFTLKDGLYLNIGYLLNYFIYQVSSLWL